jgi:oxalate decarboxylase/phosphoglucose isomerase-like protein (cupin superfamily)
MCDLGPGVAVYVPPKTVHRLINKGDGDFEIITIFVPPVDLAAVAGYDRVQIPQRSPVPLD